MGIKKGDGLRNGITGLLIGAFLLGAVFGFSIGQPQVSQGLQKAGNILRPIASQNVREYTLVIQGTEIEVGEKTVWHAWTFNGTVQGPTLKARTGETVRITVINNHNITHRFGVHPSVKEMKNDVSQTSAISGIGAVIPPGKSSTYELPTSKTGFFYYHSHPPEHEHVMSDTRQGLYGVIVVDDSEKPHVRDLVTFLSEMGPSVSGENIPYYTMNGKGFAGGEPALQKLYKEKGMGAIERQFNKTVLVFKVKIGETVRMHTVNVGDAQHSLHLHGILPVEHEHDGNEEYHAEALWPHNEVVFLPPGSDDEVLLVPQFEGVYLLHCYITAHANGGMVGLLIVER